MVTAKDGPGPQAFYYTRSASIQPTGARQTRRANINLSQCALHNNQINKNMAPIQMRISISEMLAGRENNLNALRLLAAVLVLFSHCYPLSGNLEHEPIARHLHVFDGGAVAVIAFFFLSGYLISSSWSSAPHFPIFMMKRACRILPGLAVVVILCALVLGPLMTSLDIGDYFRSGQILKYVGNNINVLSLNNNTLPGVFEHLPFSHGINGSLWTLKIEFLAYIATGLIGASRLLPPQGKGIHAILFSAAGLYIAARLTALSKADWDALHLPLQFFSCQLVAAYLIGTVAFAVRLWLPRSWFIFAALACLNWLFRDGSLFYFSLYLSYGYFLLLLASSPFRLLGAGVRTHDYSYGIYIYAFPIQQTLVSLVPGITPTTLFFSALPIVFLFAGASWHYVEKPALRLKAFPFGANFRKSAG